MLFRLLLGAVFALPFIWPAATQSPNTSLGSLTAQSARQQLTLPQTGDLLLTYRGQNGDVAYTQSAVFMLATSAANASANFGGL